MSSNSILFALSALSIASAWPIFFYQTDQCTLHPIIALEHPPQPNFCFDFGHVDVKSYSGSTRDEVQKVLLYNAPLQCHQDAAHHAYPNHTIHNGTTSCHSFNTTGIPRSFVFLEEILGPVPKAVGIACNGGLAALN
ncbi:hypothetical protein K439DRAFT_1623575 [Ramaria rubella]|nr:hypothetical protein K439DRAFT_1623575 [Ramaria rubella]